MLSHAGYAKLGWTDRAPTDGGAFAAGMLARGDLLNDANAVLDDAWRARPDVLVLIGDDPDRADAWTSAGVDAAEVLVTDIVVALGGDILFGQAGRAIFRTQPDGQPEGIEHFGYVDGRSQPLMLAEQVAEEQQRSGTAVWDPAFPLSQVLVSDPAAADDKGFGSFFVFRKLEQDVVAFKAAEKELQDLTDAAGQRLGEAAGAMLVGRFEDGTPVTLDCRSLEERVRDDGVDPHVPVPNDFDYSADMQGLRCPFHGHIRKTNPREDTVRLSGGDPTGAARAAERSRLMARRGITYGRRDATLDPSDKAAHLGKGPVGLLFMAYQNDIAHQFEFTQQSWANEPRFAPGFFGGDDPGRNPIIGQRGANDAVELAIRHGCNDAAATVQPREFAEFVTFKGGEYFFAPARSTLLAL